MQYSVKQGLIASVKVLSQKIKTTTVRAIDTNSWQRILYLYIFVNTTSTPIPRYAWASAR
jgi:hypothetical protein